MGAYGDAGLIITNNSDTAQKIKILRNHGSAQPYEHDCLGINSRCDTFQAAVLLAKLPYINHFNNIRRRNAKRYIKNLKNLKEIELPYESPNRHHIYHQFSIKAKNRNELRKFLNNHKINTNIYYETPLNKQKIINSLNLSGNQKTIFSDKISKNILSLPIAPSVKLNEIDYTSKIIKLFYHGRI